MSDVIYQYQQGYTPNNGNTFYFWVDCTKEFHDEEASERGTVRTLYATAQPVSDGCKVPEGWKLVPVEPSWEMISAAIKHHEGDAFLPVSLYKTMLKAAPGVQDD